MKRQIASLVLIGLFSSLSIAADAPKCKLTITREACAGHEAESYDKCKEKVAACPAAEVEAASEVECAKAAMKACENARLNITKSKVVTATFGDKKLKDGKDFCNPKSAEFNKCDKK